MLELVLAIGVAGIVVLFQNAKKNKRNTPKDRKDYYKLQNLMSEMKQRLDSIQMMNLLEQNLSRSEMMKREEQKSRLRNALRSCSKEIGSRSYVIEYIKELLQTEFCVNEETIAYVLPFQHPQLLSCEDMFLLLYLNGGSHSHSRRFEELCEEFHWDKEKENEYGLFYEISKDELKDAFYSRYDCSDYHSKLLCVAQKIYQELYGLGICDLLIFDESIDDCAAGCGGITNTDYHFSDQMAGITQEKIHCYDSIWIIYHGKKLRMSCLSLGSQKNLERTVKSLAANTEGRLLTRQNGYLLINTQKQRIAVARPPHSSSWTFYVRNLGSVEEMSLEKLFLDEGNESLCYLLKMIVMANQSFVITGEQASGKTTTLRAMLPLIDQRLSIRVVESIFEIQANNLYPKRNIQLIQELGTRSLSDAISFLKKTNADVTILGELDETRKAGLLVQLCQTGGLFTMSTAHHSSTKKLVDYLRNSLLEHTDLNHPEIAEIQVVDSIHFDIHQGKTIDGRRFIQRVTEIVPSSQSTGYIQREIAEKNADCVSDRDNDNYNGQTSGVGDTLDQVNAEREDHNGCKVNTRSRAEDECKIQIGDEEDNGRKEYMANEKYSNYKIRNILEWREGRYQLCNRISEAGLLRMKEQLSSENYQQFVAWLNQIYEETESAVA